MKIKNDPRHSHRIKLIKLLFAWEFKKNNPKNLELLKISRNIKAIDKVINAKTPQWSTEKMAKIDLAILRLAVYELVFVKKEPVKVVIDEAVELAKAFGAGQSAAFVNGVLGSVYDAKFT